MIITAFILGAFAGSALTIMTIAVLEVAHRADERDSN